MDVDARIRYTNISKKSILLRQMSLYYLSSRSFEVTGEKNYEIAM
jgi:hypothetical protein